MSSVSGNLSLSLTYSSSTISPCSWVLVIGAMHHIWYVLDFFISSKPIFNSSVMLPNGHFVSISRIGSIRLMDTIILANVLFIPSFHFNLLSVSSLTRQDSISIHFSSDSCTLQDHSQERRIEMGNCVGNLYILNLNNLLSTSSCFSSVCNNITLTQKELWHFRLGHPSDVKLQILKNELKFSQIFVDSLPCKTKVFTICFIKFFVWSTF